MDLTSSWFLILIIVLGGGVAALADNIGRTLGKKRLRLGRMRPKHTAIFLTVLTGMIVTTVTILLVAALSAEAREWIIRGRTAIKEGRIAVTERDRVKKELVEIKRQLKESQTKLKEMTGSMGQMEGRLESTSEKLTAAEKQTNAALGKNRLLDRQARALSAKVKSTNSSLLKARELLAKAQRSYESVQGSFNAIRTQLEDQMVIYDKLQDAIDKLEQSKGMTEEDLRKAKVDLAAQIKALDEANNKYTAAVAEYQKSMEGLSEELTSAQKQIDGLKNFAQSVWGTSRDNPMIFAKHEEMARLEIKGTTDSDEADFALRRLLGAARSVAGRRGARQNENSQEAGFISFQDPKTKIWITPAMQYTDVVRQILNPPEDKLLVALASFNAFRDEFVILDVYVYKNPIVFSQGAFLAEERIPNDLSQSEILDRISNFMKTKVREKAIQSGMIGIAGQEAAFGEVENETILALIEQIRQTGRTVRLQAFAKNETRAAGPLHVEFRLRP